MPYTINNLLQSITSVFAKQLQIVHIHEHCQSACDCVDQLRFQKIGANPSSRRCQPQLLTPMPLDLTLQVESASTSAPASSSQSTVAHCFGRLPSDVAHSLNGIEPFASLIVLQVRHIPTSRLFYIAWDGGVTGGNSSLFGLHERFAEALDMRDGDRLKVTIAERLVGNDPAKFKFPLKSAVVKPLSYARSDHQQHQRDYSALSLAAEALQQSFLSCIRILSPSLHFALALPARVDISLSVVSVDVQTKDKDVPPYAIVCPNSMIEIEPPPLAKSLTVVPFFSRAVTVSRAAFQELSTHILNTHAIVHDDRDSKDVFGCALVSRKGAEHHAKSNIAVPVRVTRHSAVPKHGLFLPPSVWHRLQLQPLTPILVEPISIESSKQLSLVSIIPTSPPAHAYPSVLDLSRAQAVLFDGMQIKEGVIRIDDGKYPLVMPSVKRPWSDSDLKKPDDIDLVPVDFLSDPLFQDPLPSNGLTKHKITASLLNRRHVLQPVIAAPELVLTHLDVPDLARASTIADDLPWTDERNRRDLIQALTPTLQGRLNSALRTIKQWIHRKKEGVSFAVGVEGMNGNGRTHLSQTLGSVLQNGFAMRNINIHGRLFMMEDVNVRLRRLQEAFQAAQDCGSGLIIIDDFDLFSGIRSQQEQNEEQNGQKEESLVIAQWIHSLLFHHTSCHSVLLILVCERTDDLPQLLRIPGNIVHVTSLPEPSRKDRAFLFFHRLRAESRSLIRRASSIEEEFFDKANSENDHSSQMSTNIMKQAVKFSKRTEGFCVKDIDICITRARVLAQSEIERGLSLEDSMNGDAMQTLYQAMGQTLKDMTPLSQISSGTKATADAEELDLRWEKLGGVVDVREALVEILELWTRNEGILGMIPIRLTRGVLLYGPPGNGKTKIALTAAKEAGLSTIFIKGAELLGKYVGQSEREVRRVFEQAGARPGNVIIFDEFDALATARGDANAGVGDRVVNTLLACMDGVDRAANNSFVIATSSRPETIDRALIRPGRLDKWIKIDFPSTEEKRYDILHRCLRHMFELTQKVNEPVNNTISQIAANTHGYSAADLEGLVNDAFNQLHESNLNQDSTKNQVRSSQSPDDTEDVNFDENDIVEALSLALKGSRPSLSATQRSYYAMTMARFSGEMDMVDQIGQKLTLK